MHGGHGSGMTTGHTGGGGHTLGGQTTGGGHGGGIGAQTGAGAHGVQTHAQFAMPPKKVTVIMIEMIVCIMFLWYWGCPENMNNKKNLNKTLIEEQQMRRCEFKFSKRFKLWFVLF